jgi:uncharacterized protein (DUF2235 family)
MPKNIIILSDGTGQKGGINENTNVYKLFNFLEDRTPEQVVYYDPGIGTDFRGIFGSITGRGFSQNMLQCYRFLFDNYEAGDKVFLFGFSRGAATVRSLSGFIHLFGVLPSCRPDLIKEAFRIYKKKNTEKRKELADAFIAKHHTMWLQVHFIGVWDTVAALGFPNKLFDAFANLVAPHHFHDFALSKCVDYARHAISIDDERKTFHPVLWDPLPPGSDPDRLKQVWFCGVHTDVGGGYAKRELSYYSLEWMIREARAKGLRLFEKEDKTDNWNRYLAARKFDIDGHMHDELTGFKAYIFRRKVRSWPPTHGRIVIHKSVLERKKNQRNETDPAYRPWIFDIQERDIEE